MRLVLAVALASWGAAAAAGAEPTHKPVLSAAQIVAKNVAARGGLEAWRKVETMVWIGHMETANAPTGLPFVLQQKRPNKTRFELTAMGRKSVRVFDGARGWNVRPGAHGKPIAQPYSLRELKFAQQATGIDGPLIDSAAQGRTVTLDGIDDLEGRKAFRLNVKSASGESHRLWIDAETFLDIKYDRTSYNAAGVPGTVSVYYRDYKTFEGLQIPSRLEIGAGSAQAPDRMVIERVVVNPPLDDKLFARPPATAWRRAGDKDAAAWASARRAVIPSTPSAASAPSDAPAAPAATTPDPDVVPR